MRRSSFEPVRASAPSRWGRHLLACVVATVFSILLVTARADAAGKLPELDIHAAQITSFELAGLGLDPRSVAVAVSDPTVRARVTAGLLNVMALQDPGADVPFTITVQEPSGRKTVLAVKLRTTFPLAPSPEGDEGAVPSIRVSGLGPRNSLRSVRLAFETPMKRDVRPDLSTLRLDNGIEQPFDFGSLLQFDSVTKELFVAADVMSTTPFRTGVYDIVIGFVGTDHASLGTYRIRSAKAQAVIRGTVVEADGSAATTLAGRWIGLADPKSGVRTSVRIDDAGQFVAPDMPTGIYVAELLDLAAPGLTKGTVSVYTYDTNVVMTLTRMPPSGIAAGVGVKGGRTKAGAIVTGTSRGDGKVTRSRTGVRSSTPAPAPTATATPTSTSTSCTATADGPNDTIACTVSLPVPAGTTYLTVQRIVSTPEFPIFTGSQSVYDDTWSFDVVGIPGRRISQIGHVNDSHKTVGVLTETSCSKIPGSLSTAGFAVTGVGRATNIVDNLLSTSITVTLTTGCDQLVVDGAWFKTTNKVGYSVISGYPGYGGVISIPTITRPTDWGVPLVVKYSPETAQISAAKLNVISQGVVVATADLDLPAGTGNGKIEFNDLIVPKLGLNWTSSAVSFNIQLTGTVAGTQMVTDGTSPNVATTIDGTRHISYKPLFLANDEPTLATRRFSQGSPDPGLDSWATNDTIDWLLNGGHAPRFNDISALHGAHRVTSACRRSKRSVLGHCSHNEGTSIDARYADGSGGYGDLLGGADNGSYIRQLAVDAEAEQMAGTTTGPKLSLLRSWVADNRSLMENLSADSRVASVGFGTLWFSRLLADGRYPDGTAIDGISPWARPARVTPLDSHHLSHWHVELTHE